MASPAAPIPNASEVSLPLGPAMSRTRRLVMLALGWVSLGLGILGMFLPLLPTTCFLLGAAWAFSRSSPALHRWMLSNRLFGGYLRDYKEGRGFPARVKLVSLAVMWGTMALTVVAVPALWLAAVLAVIGGAVTWHLYQLPTKQTV